MCHSTHYLQKVQKAQFALFSPVAAAFLCSNSVIVESDSAVAFTVVVLNLSFPMHLESPHLANGIIRYLYQKLTASPNYFLLLPKNCSELVYDQLLVLNPASS